MVVSSLVTIIVGSVLFFLVVLFGILFLVISRVRQRARAAIKERFGDSAILRSDPLANFFGQQSKGGAQIRGNGGLVLTKDVIWFHLVVPERELEIPLSQVTGVRIEKWFLSKTKGRPILVVDFDLGAGPDAAGWLVRDPEAWRNAILRAAPAR